MRLARWGENSAKTPGGAGIQFCRDRDSGEVERAILSRKFDESFLYDIVKHKSRCSYLV